MRARLDENIFIETISTSKTCRPWKLTFESRISHEKAVLDVSRSLELRVVLEHHGRSDPGKLLYAEGEDTLDKLYLLGNIPTNEDSDEMDSWSRLGDI